MTNVNFSRRLNEALTNEERAPGGAELSARELSDLKSLITTAGGAASVVANELQRRLDGGGLSPETHAQLTELHRHANTVGRASSAAAGGFVEGALTGARWLGMGAAGVAGFLLGNVPGAIGGIALYETAVWGGQKAVR